MTNRHTPRTYADGSEDVELFALTDGMRPDVDRETQRKPASAVAWASCPHCSAEGVGLVPAGAHLLWKLHDVVTIRGVRTPCRSSGIALCQLAPRNGAMLRNPKSGSDEYGRVVVTARCRCGVEPTARAK